jgi:ubiquitin carboxyl-terminal hydrolase 4/11/15
MGEDLFRRKGKKPYVEQTDNHGDRSDKESSEEYWNKHLLRNESIITDLFHGQYKSKLVCSVCKSISIGFDIFSNLPMPIPAPPVAIKFYYVPYNAEEEGAVNWDCVVTMRQSETIYDFRKVIAEYLKVPFDSFLITKINSGKIISIFPSNGKVQDIVECGGRMVAFQIAPECGPTAMPPSDQCSKTDSNHGLDDDWCKVAMQVKYPDPPKYKTMYKNYKSF